MANDMRVIAGLNAIVNKENTRPGIDLREIERRMLSSGMLMSKVKDTSDRFQEEMSEAAKRLGIVFGDAKEAALQHVKDDPPRSSAVDEEDYVAGAAVETSHDTKEQENREHIKSVIGESADFSFEQEKKEDVKCAMLEEIDSLTGALMSEDIDLSRIPTVTKDSTYEEVEVILKMLRHKNDHNRYCSFAEEFLMFGAHALEDLFDGKRTWFNKYQPDLRGWHCHVNVKLKRMRHDTGQLVSTMMHDYNIGAGARILLELIPNMIIYSKTKKTLHSQRGLEFDDDEMASHYTNLARL